MLSTFKRPVVQIKPIDDVQIEFLTQMVSKYNLDSISVPTVHGEIKISKSKHVIPQDTTAQSKTVAQVEKPIDPDELSAWSRHYAGRI